MPKGDVKKQVISKGKTLQQAVYKTEVGKNKKGKVIYRSLTKHERIS
jgi:hypothetical protein